ncbi:MAG: MBL fold metallo-hydrolase [Deltaproteobacteria bacterium]|jgi:hypothetical protein|nr:MBL fold metallo-hydrolase [Deltaproteobacteria bacterium]
MKNVNLSRRCFLKMGSLVGTNMFLSCSGVPESVLLANSIPKHHTRDGFQNYPLVRQEASLGFEFWWKRMQASFQEPEIPRDHFISEKQAIEDYQDLKQQNSLTWLGQATFILKVNNKVILTDPFFTCA